MKLHPREQKTKKASLALEEAVLNIVREHDITFIELVQMLAACLQSWSKYALRAERHPEQPDKPAGLA